MAQEGEVQHAGTMRWWKIAKHRELKLRFSNAVVTLKCSTNSLSTFNWLCSIFLLDSLGWPGTESIHQPPKTSKNLHYFHTKFWNPFSFTGHWQRWLIRTQKCLIFWYLPCTFTSHGLEEQKRPRPTSVRSELRAWKLEFLEEVFGYWEGGHTFRLAFFFVNTLGSWSFF